MEHKYQILYEIVKKEMEGASPAHDINYVMRAVSYTHLTLPTN